MQDINAMIISKLTMVHHFLPLVYMRVSDTLHNRWKLSLLWCHNNALAISKHKCTLLMNNIITILIIVLFCVIESSLVCTQLAAPTMIVNYMTVMDDPIAIIVL